MAIVFDLSSSYVIGEAQRENLGLEVIWQGSAISAPLPPILAIALGVFLARRRGVARIVGLVQLALAGALMLVGVAGELSGDSGFERVRQGVFLVFNVLYGLLAVALITNCLLAIFKRGERAAAY